MTGFRLMIAAGVSFLAVLFNSPSYAFMENVGKGTVDSALAQLNTMGDKFISEIIQGGHDIINDMANKASNERKGAVAQVGSEFDYAIDEMNDQFGSQMKGTVRQASDELKNNLAVILAWTGSMRDVTSKLSATEDDFAIDIESLPFASKIFSIRRVSGINILQGDRSVYPIVITGEGFGQPSSGTELTISPKIGEFELQRGATLGQIRSNT